MRKGTLIGFSISLSIAVLAAGVEISAQDKLERLNRLCK